VDRERIFGLDYLHGGGDGAELSGSLFAYAVPFFLDEEILPPSVFFQVVFTHILIPSLDD
jgi:hypothetical protein